MEDDYIPSTTECCGCGEPDGHCDQDCPNAPSDPDLAHDAQEAHRILAANRDCINHFDALKTDYDRYREALEAILANEEAYKRGDALSAYIAKTALGIPV